VCLVDFNDTVDLAHEPEACQKSNCTCKDEENECNDECVSKIQESRRHSSNIQLIHEIMYRIQEIVERSKAASQKRSPPPIIVLCTQVEIAQ